MGAMWQLRLHPGSQTPACSVEAFYSPPPISKTGKRSSFPPDSRVDTDLYATDSVINPGNGRMPQDKHTATDLGYITTQMNLSSPG